jgi:hypothetical protein
VTVAVPARGPTLDDLVAATDRAAEELAAVLAHELLDGRIEFSLRPERFEPETLAAIASFGSGRPEPATAALVGASANGAAVHRRPEPDTPLVRALALAIVA